MLVFSGSKVYNASDVVGDFGISEIHGEIQLEEDTTNLENPYSHTQHSTAFISESYTEECQSNITFPNFLGISIFHLGDLELFQRNTPTIHGITETNTPPVTHISRNILFHSLQIHF